MGALTSINVVEGRLLAVPRKNAKLQLGGSKSPDSPNPVWATPPPRERLENSVTGTLGFWVSVCPAWRALNRRTRRVRRLCRLQREVSFISLYFLR